MWLFGMMLVALKVEPLLVFIVIVNCSCFKTQLINKICLNQSNWH